MCHDISLEKAASKIQNENTLAFKGRDRVGMGVFLGDNDGILCP